MRKILVIEDENSISQVLKTALERDGYEVRIEVSGQLGIQAAIEMRPECVILDLGLPDSDGHDVLLKLREWLKAPIIVLTARDNDDDKVRALDSGADDYLTKPFSAPEFLARVRVGLRHFDSNLSKVKYRYQLLECDITNHDVRINGKALKLTATEYDILRVLIENVGRVVTHRTLLKSVWGPNSVEHPQYLRVYVGQLRKKLKSAGQADEVILTEPGVGYRLVEAHS